MVLLESMLCITVVRGEGIVWYLILNSAVAIWVFFDARKRHMDLPGIWAVLAFIAMVMALPFYLAKRTLKNGEIRKGGSMWSFSKSFAIIWTAFMLVAGVSARLATRAAVAKAGVTAGHAGEAMLTGFSFSLIAGLWFLILVADLGIGLYFRKPGSVEIGSTR
jgi:hypothetical protein